MSEVPLYTHVQIMLCEPPVCGCREALCAPTPTLCDQCHASRSSPPLPNGSNHAQEGAASSTVAICLSSLGACGAAGCFTLLMAAASVPCRMFTPEHLRRTRDSRPRSCISLVLGGAQSPSQAAASALLAVLYGAAPFASRARTRSCSDEFCVSSSRIRRSFSSGPVWPL